MIPTLGAMALFVALTLLGEWRSRRLVVWLCKPAASVAFLVLAYQSSAFDSDIGLAIFSALSLSLIGDVCLIPKSQGALLAGLGAFLLAHGAYGAAFLLARPDWALTGTALVGMVLVAGFVARWLLPKVDRAMKAPVLCYIAAIVVMVALSAGASWAVGDPTPALGATLFMISDLSVARDRFVAREFANRLWGLPLYYAAQALLAWSAGRFAAPVGM